MHKSRKWWKWKAPYFSPGTIASLPFTLSRHTQSTAGTNLIQNYPKLTSFWCQECHWCITNPRKNSFIFNLHYPNGIRHLYQLRVWLKEHTKNGTSFDTPWTPITTNVDVALEETTEHFYLIRWTPTLLGELNNRARQLSLSWKCFSTSSKMLLISVTNKSLLIFLQNKSQTLCV